MTIVEVERHGRVVIGEGDHPAAYQAAEWLRSSRPAIGAVANPVRMHVEVLRRFGGLAPRALVGGQFARAVAGALGEGPGLPAGTLTIDRAGFDLVNSSEVILGQAAAVLKTALSAQLSGQDADAAARSLVSTW
jgi:hypothetical protein